MSRIALLSDVHGNLVALEAVLASLGPFDRLWVTGDIVGYGPDPSDVLALLRARNALMVAGNHDLAVATGQGLEMFNEYAEEAARMHREWLSPEERDFLAGLPQVSSDAEFTLCHGSLRQPLWEYVTTSAAAGATLKLARTTHCCNGHTHVPVIFGSRDGRIALSLPTQDRAYPLEGRLLINSGSVGQPRDGDPRAAYAVLDTDAGTVTFRRTSYEVHETQRRIRRRGLPEFLADRLAVGL